MRFLLLCLFTFLLCYCKDHSEPVKQYDNSKVNFYPFIQFFNAQIKDVTSTPYFIYKIESAEQHRDSSVIKNEEFVHLAASFLSDNIDDAKIRNYYKENAFHDPSLQTITFNYTTVHPTLPVRSMDIITDESGSVVKRVFITKQINRNDTAFDIKLGWKKDESFFINTSVAIDKKETIKQTKVVWNDKSEKN